MQIRNYFGKSLGNKFEIDKYVSYVRFKQYLNNDFNTARSRTHEWRMRVAPAYNINSNLKLGLTLTYNNYLLKNNSNQEDINLAGSVRYAFDNMAVLFLADFDAFNTDDRGLVPVENGIEDTTYRLNFTYYAL